MEGRIVETKKLLLSEKELDQLEGYEKAKKLLKDYEPLLRKALHNAPVGQSGFYRSAVNIDFEESKAILENEFIACIFSYDANGKYPNFLAYVSGKVNYKLHNQFRSKEGDYARLETNFSLDEMQENRLDMPTEDSYRVFDSPDRSVYPEVIEAFEKLTQKQQEAIELVVINEMSYVDVADILGITKQSVNERVKTGLKRMESQLRV